ncbi:MAG: hypothetical protein ACTSRU_21215 [Candidatus Hodarchaeales archaeon]
MYDYQDYKPELFKEENQEMFLKIRDGIAATIQIAGCITMGKAIDFGNGDPWLRMAMVDRLVEVGEIIEVKRPQDVAGQHRIFIKY